MTTPNVTTHVLPIIRLNLGKVFYQVHATFCAGAQLSGGKIQVPGTVTSTISNVGSGDVASNLDALGDKAVMAVKYIGLGPAQGSNRSRVENCWTLTWSVLRRLRTNHLLLLSDTSNIFASSAFLSLPYFILSILNKTIPDIVISSLSTVGSDGRKNADQKHEIEG